MLRVLAITLCCLAMAACHGSQQEAVDDYYLRPITLPDGTVIKAETLYHQADMSRGMMFRESAPEGRGMLFMHNQPGNYGYWMYQVKVPLDIIWMTVDGLVVEMVENAPPCKEAREKCPSFGGTRRAMVVLELPGGTARKHGVAVGQSIKF
jgi:uncharacterized membrane protein (UPF0127 family)